MTRARARYRDGEPANLVAAAQDALEWLRFWRDYMQYPVADKEHPGERLDASTSSALDDRTLSAELVEASKRGDKWNEQRRRMEAAIVSLEGFLQDGKSQFDTWQPMPNGVKMFDNFDTISISDDLLIVVPGSTTGGATLPSDIRLCRKVIA